MVARDLAARQAREPARQPDRDDRADLQRRRHRHARHAGRIARQRDAAHPGRARERAGLDLNRDAVKLQTVEANGLYRMLNDWDPVLLLDGHLMSRVSHGYANTYGTTTVPAAAPGPRDYTHDTLFPAVRDMVRRDFGLEVFTHALPAPGRCRRRCGVTTRAAWTVEAKFVVNDYGLRNRLAIITETPGQPTFERRIYAQYAYIMALLDYTNAHAKEMQAVVKAADDETVADVMARRRGRHAAQLPGRRIPVARQDRSARVPHERRRSIGRARASSARSPARPSGRPKSCTTSTTSRARRHARRRPCRARISFRRSSPTSPRSSARTTSRSGARRADARRGRGVHDSEDAQGAQRAATR